MKNDTNIDHQDLIEHQLGPEYEEFLDAIPTKKRRDPMDDAFIDDDDIPHTKPKEPKF